jgi:hypothetical protein
MITYFFVNNLKHNNIVKILCLRKNKYRSSKKNNNQNKIKDNHKGLLKNNKKNNNNNNSKSNMIKIKIKNN